MADKPEIYPFQRMSGKRPPEWTAPRLRRPAIFSVGNPYTWQKLKALLTSQTLILGVVALILGRAFLLGEILPFALAFAAVFCQRDQKGWVFPLLTIAGLATIARGYVLWSNVATLIGIYIIFRQVKITGSQKWWAYPALSILSVLVIKTIYLVFNDQTIYREIVIIFEALAVGILTFVFLVLRDSLDQRRNVSEYNFEDSAALAILGIGVLVGLADVRILELSVTGVLCRLGIMISAYLWGVSGGTVFGVAGGIIPSLSTMALSRTLAVYAFSGLLAGLFRSFSKMGVILGFVTGNMILSVFILGFDQTAMTLWETAVAAAFFLIVPADFKERVPIKSLGLLSENLGRGKGSSHLKELTAERMNSLAKVFEEISMTFADTEPKPAGSADNSYISNIFQTLTGFFCRKCAVYQSCWETEFYQTYRELFNLISLGESKGSLDYDDIPTSFRRKCIRPKELTTAINGVLETVRANEFWENKLEESRGLLSQQLKEVSGVIKSLAQEINFDSAVDHELKARLERECIEMGIPVHGITPIIADNQYVYIKVAAEACLDRETCDTLIAPSISAAIGTRYEVSQRKCPRSGRGNCEFTLARAFGFNVVTGVAQLPRAEVSGDSFNVATLKDGREFLVLSDGMGVGARAAQESKATVNLLEEMFNTGFGQEIALKTINSILLLRNQGESFATIDLALINLYTGEVEFVKIGGVPSYLKRDQRVGIIMSESLPVGIVDNLEISTERRSLLPGDILVMVTDGVLEPGRSGKNSDQWLRKYLSGVQEKDPHRLAEMIINRALELARGEPRDDMTVLCARIDSR